MNEGLAAIKELVRIFSEGSHAGLAEAYKVVSDLQLDEMSFIEAVRDADNPEERNRILKAIRGLQNSDLQPKRDLEQEMSMVFRNNPKTYEVFLGKLMERATEEKIGVLTGCKLFLEMKGLDSARKQMCKNAMRDRGLSISDLSLPEVVAAANVRKVEAPKKVADDSADGVGLVPMRVGRGKISEKEAEIDRKIEFSLCVAEFENIDNESVKQAFKNEIFGLIAQQDDGKSENATARLNNLKLEDVKSFVAEVNKTISAEKEVTPKAFRKLMASENTPSSINHVFAGIKADVFAAEKKEGLLSKLRSKKDSAAEHDAGPKKGLKDLLPKRKLKYYSINEPFPTKFGRGK